MFRCWTVFCQDTTLDNYSTLRLPGNRLMVTQPGCDKLRPVGYFAPPIRLLCSHKEREENRVEVPAWPGRLPLTLMETYNQKNPVRASSIFSPCSLTLRFNTKYKKKKKTCFDLLLSAFYFICSFSEPPSLKRSILSLRYFCQQEMEYNHLVFTQS